MSVHDNTPTPRCPHCGMTPDSAVPLFTAEQMHTYAADLERRLQEAWWVVEFAKYLATGAEQLLDAIAAEGFARLAHEEAAREDCVLEIRAAEAVEHAIQASIEFATGLRSDIYEFRKRLPTAPSAAAGKE